MIRPGNDGLRNHASLLWYVAGMSRRRSPLAFAMAVAIGWVVSAHSLHAQIAQLPCDSVSLATSEIKTVRFVGNTHFQADELDQHVLTTASDFGRRVLHFFGTRRCLGPLHVTLADDIASLRRFYADQGFPDARIDTLVKAHPGGGLDVTFRVLAEGRPVLIDSLTIEGLDHVKQRGDILRRLNVTDTSRRFSAALVVADADSIRARLGNAGYPLSSVALDSETVGGDLYRRTVLLVIDPATAGALRANHDTGHPVRHGQAQASADLGQRCRATIGLPRWGCIQLSGDRQRTAHAV